jgi:hypothetical protein
MAGTYPLPFWIESDGAQYAIVERQNIAISNTELYLLVQQSMAWVVEALRIDGRSDFRWGADEQDIAQFLCGGDEYMKIKMAAWQECGAAAIAGVGVLDFR